MFFNNFSPDTKLYDILKISKNSTPAEIKKSYRKLAMKYHPDRNPENKEVSEKKFKEISMAYDILGDTEKKETYDRVGLDGLKAHSAGADAGGGDPFNMFSNFFGEPSMRRNFTSPSKKEKIKVCLEDIYNNNSIAHSIKKQILCTDCLGLGAKSRQSFDSCNNCNGTGQLLKIMKLGPGFISQTQTTCHRCNGKGKSIKPGHICKKCNGEKVIYIYKKYTIELKNSYKNNQELVFREEGDQYPDSKQHGDLIILLEIIKHTCFELKDNNLIYSKNISLIEALCGFKFNIKHLDDRILLVENNDIIAPNTKKLILGEGINNSGNLIINFNVIFPKNKKITDEKKIYIKRLFSNIYKEENTEILPGIKVDMIEYVNTNEQIYSNKEPNNEHVMGCAQQ